MRIENIQSQPRNSVVDGDDDILSNIKYICKTTAIITEALQNGCDVAQLPNGDLIVTEVKTINTQYTWNSDKDKIIKGQQW